MVERLVAGGRGTPTTMLKSWPAAAAAAEKASK